MKCLSLVVPSHATNCSEIECVRANRIFLEELALQKQQKQQLNIEPRQETKTRAKGRMSPLPGLPCTQVRPMFERRRAMAEEKLIAASAASASSAGKAGGGNRSSPDPVSAAVVQSLDAKLETIDDLIARLEIEEGEVGRGHQFYTRHFLSFTTYEIRS